MPVAPHHKHQARRPVVTDDLPHDIPITEDEVRVLDAWFGELLDELLGLTD